MTRSVTYRNVLLLITFTLLATAVWLLTLKSHSTAWSEEEVRILRSLSIASLGPIPPSPANAVADSLEAAELGRQFFFDKQFSANGKIACASCHQPERRFTDGITKGQGLGTSGRNTLSIVASAYSPWLYWDGRRDSVWSQALSPLEDQNEHGTDRMQVVRSVVADVRYQRAYVALFGPLPEVSSGPGDAWKTMTSEDQQLVNTIFANIGKSLAAYVRLVQPTPSRFDAYVQTVLNADEQAQRETFDASEISGLRLFIGKANCIQCHNGALFTNHEFHNTGVISFPGDVPDKGRFEGVSKTLADPFNCLGSYSDDPGRDCNELRFVRRGAELIGAFRTPSLRNLEGTAPYMHKGQLATLAEVLEHYNRAPIAMIGHNETLPLGLSRNELKQLEKFLRTLDAPVMLPLP